MLLLFAALFKDVKEILTSSQSREPPSEFPAKDTVAQTCQ